MQLISRFIFVLVLAEFFLQLILDFFSTCNSFCRAFTRIYQLVTRKRISTKHKATGINFQITPAPKNFWRYKHTKNCIKMWTEEDTTINCTQSEKTTKESCEGDAKSVQITFYYIEKRKEVDCFEGGHSLLLLSSKTLGTSWI